MSVRKHGIHVSGQKGDLDGDYFCVDEDLDHVCLDYALSPSVHLYRQDECTSREYPGVPIQEDSSCWVISKKQHVVLVQPFGGDLPSTLPDGWDDGKWAKVGEVCLFVYTSKYTQNSI